VGRGPIKHGESSEESFLVHQLSLIKYFGSYIRAAEILFEIPTLFKCNRKQEELTVIIRNLNFLAEKC
jgi:hypothetical protein